MSQGHRWTQAAPRRRSLPLVASVLALAGIAAIVVLSVPGRGGEDGLVQRRMAMEMPPLDTGIAQVVHATFVGDRRPSLGQAAEMRLVLTSAVPDLDVSAKLDAPSGADLTGGLASWNGTMGRLEVVEIPVNVRMDGDRGGFVRAEIVGRTADGREYRSATACYVDPGESDSPEPEAKTLIEPDGTKLDIVVHKPSDR